MKSILICLIIFLTFGHSFTILEGAYNNLLSLQGQGCDYICMDDLECKTKETLNGCEHVIGLANCRDCRFQEPF